MFCSSCSRINDFAMQTCCIAVAANVRTGLDCGVVHTMRWTGIPDNRERPSVYRISSREMQRPECIRFLCLPSPNLAFQRIAIDGLVSVAETDRLRQEPDRFIAPDPIGLGSPCWPKFLIKRAKG